jgi:NADPH:quinone reductase-like Zn-dependent oxidoreductase
MNPKQVPGVMKAIVLEAYNSNLGRVLRSLSIQEKEIRTPGDDEVLVRMDGAPCNPSDIAFLRGMYIVARSVPVIPGFEGTGTVVATGRALPAMNLWGKRVSCFSQDSGEGTWAEYFTVRAANCIPVRESLSVEQAACLAVNPFTAAGLMEIAAVEKHRAIILTAAGGQVSAFIRKMAGNTGIPVINIVRSDHQVHALSDVGEQYVLNQKGENFPDRLKSLSKQLEATIAFDAVGGEMTGILLNAMPHDSQVILYGGLSGLPAANLDILEVIFHGKSLRGFNLADWISRTSPERFSEISCQLQDQIISGKLSTRIQATFPFDQAVRGLLQYVGNMSKGKVLFVP